MESLLEILLVFFCSFLFFLFFFILVLVLAVYLLHVQELLDLMAFFFILDLPSLNFFSELPCKERFSIVVPVIFVFVLVVALKSISSFVFRESFCSL
jgi:hypothetical membrane protein